MRRKELAVDGPEFFAEIARDCRVGHLALAIPGVGPRSIAVDFAAIGQDIFFHGALSGEKYAAICDGPPVGFTLVKELSFIPSHWLAPRHACPATHLFKSVEIRGQCRVVVDVAEKAGALQALMEKYQPEGGFASLDPELDLYRRSIAKVGVFRVVTATWTGKAKLAQNETEAVRRKIIDRLRERGEALDLITATEIGATLPSD